MSKKSLSDENKNPGNLWNYFSNLDHSALATPDFIEKNKIYKSELGRFKDNQHYFDLISNNAQPFLKYVIEEIENRDMPVFLALLPAIESSYRADVTSSWKAAGLWQFIPSTGKQFGLKQNWWYDGRRDVVASTSAALNYLQQLYDQFDDWSLALAAYNSGTGTVLRAIRKNTRAGKKIDYWSLDLPPETRNYIPRLLALGAVISAPGKYNIKLPEIVDEPAISQVDIKGQIQLTRVADLANVDINELRQLNAAHGRWATDPNGPHKLIVPADSAQRLELGIERLDDNDRVTWHHHKIKSGESLSTIAQKYRVSVTALKTANKLNSNVIRTGKSLLVPGSELAANDAVDPFNKNTPAVPDDSERHENKSESTELTGNLYRIQSGDSLSMIAQRFNVSLKQILQWNNIDANHVLVPGKKLKILVQQTALETASL